MCAVFIWVEHHSMKGKWLFLFSKHLDVVNRHNFSGLLVMYHLYPNLALHGSRYLLFTAILLVRSWSGFAKAPVLPPQG